MTTETAPGFNARRTLSGLEYMRLVAKGEFEGAPMVRHLGMHMTEARDRHLHPVSRHRRVK